MFVNPLRIALVHLHGSTDLEPLSAVGSRYARAPIASAHTAPATLLAPGPSLLSPQAA